MSNLHCRNKLLALALIKYTKIAIKMFWSCLSLLLFEIFLKIICTGLSVETNAKLQLIPVSFKL